MRARKLIETGPIPPEALALVFQAFDEAWAEIAHHYAGDAKATEHARLRLAHAVLAVGEQHPTDAVRIKSRALKSMLATETWRGQVSTSCTN